MSHVSDYRLETNGAICWLHPLNDQAEENLQHACKQEGQMTIRLNGALAVRTEWVQDMVEKLNEKGWTVQYDN